MNHKMVVLDLDGTLLNDRKELSPFSIKVLSELQSRRVEIVVATGRRYKFVKDLFRNTGLEVTALCSGGTLARHTGDDGKIMARYVDNRLFCDIVEIGREYFLHPLLHVDHREEGYDFLLEYEKSSPFYRSYLRDEDEEYLVVGDFLQHPDNRVLLMCFMGELSVLSNFQARLNQRFNRLIHSHILTTLDRIGPVLEIMNPEGTKWKTLVSYAASLGIKPSQIIAIGDDNNDVELIKNCGLGIAMRNGTDQVKSAAAAVSGYSNNENGAARELINIFGLTI